MKRFRANLTYSNVVASLALFLALAGGTAIAATQVLPKNSVGSKQIKNEAITLAKISKSARTALKGATGATGATRLQGATGPAGSPGKAGESAPKLWAMVSATGELEEGSGAVSAREIFGGRFEVIFNRNVSHCAYNATIGKPGVPPDGTVVVAPLESNEDGVFVATFSTSSTEESKPFYLTVVC